jgi:hypothetical protein
VLFPEDDHVIEGLSPNGADDPFGVWILPGRPWCDGHFVDPHVLDTLPEVGFSRDMRPMSVRISASFLGRPPLLDFHRQYSLKP